MPDLSQPHIKRKVGAMLLVLLGACGLVFRCTTPDPLDLATYEALYATPALPPEPPLNVYHLGHSLVGQTMPAMLRQISPEGHEFRSQLGWGSFLREHWELDVPVKGFAESNTHAEYREPHDAMESGTYDALVLTEAIGLRDAIKYFTPHDYLWKWSQAAWENNPDAVVYFYETWHGLDDPEGWLMRLDRDLALYWEGEILRRSLSYQKKPRPIYIIPGGQVMARFVRALEASGGVGPLKDRHDLFSDQIHFNDYGAYLIALTHYAVLYQSSPLGLPHDLLRADGSPADDPGPEAAQLMQKVVWEVVRQMPQTGVPQAH